jgi:RHS repeat-associated protein
MDQLTYKYLYAKTDNTKGEFIPGQPVTDPLFDHYTNQLASVQDAIGDNNYTIDIDAQDAFNYEYDKIGNLVKDVKEGITNVSWTVYGKINSITKVKDGATTTINYTYDASGNRISKTAIPPQGAAKTTLYVRDASGNTMSVYEKETAGAIKQTEIHLYGSSRIGMVTEPSKPAIPDADLNNAYLSTFTRSEKIFELCNHLQNVLVTISDKKIGVDNNNDGNVDYYNADVITANDFYPFGSLMPGRKYSQSNSTYRYGFNGKENDNEVKGEGNQIDYGMRIYDPRLGRFLSVDPLNRSFPYFSPYHFAGCSPIKFVDMDGGEPQDYVDKWEPRPIGHAKTSQLVGNGENNSRIFVNDPLIGWVSVQLIYDKTTNQNWFVHHNNSGKNYYYQRDDGQHDKLLLQVPKNGISTITGGSLTEFETQDAAQARIGGEVATGMATFWSVTLGGTLAGGGNFVYGVVMGLLEDALGVPILNSPDDFARSRKSAVDGLNLKKKLASEQQMSEVGDIIAGGTHQKPLRKASDLAKEYGGDPADWVKKRSSSYTAEDGTQFETHWEENLKTGQRVNMKSTEIKTVSTQSPEENPTKRPYDN